MKIEKIGNAEHDMLLLRPQMIDRVRTMLQVGGEALTFRYRAGQQTY